MALLASDFVKGADSSAQTGRVHAHICHSIGIFNEQHLIYLGFMYVRIVCSRFSGVDGN
jgi:hypothetical protein